MPGAPLGADSTVPLALALGSMADLPSRDDWLSADERRTLASFRFPKRADDWRLGRWTAKRAVAARLAAADRSPGEPSGSGAPLLDSIRIVAATDGAPEAEVGGTGDPVPVAVSISHSHGRSFCVAGLMPVRLGCDIELLEPRTEGFVRDYLTGREAAAVSAADAALRPLLATLCWSAKESSLKARRTGLRADTRTIDVDLEVGDGPVHDWSPLLAHEVATGTVLHGWWIEDAGSVLTLVSSPPPERPARPDGTGGLPWVGRPAPGGSTGPFPRGRGVGA